MSICGFYFSENMKLIQFFNQIESANRNATETSIS